MSLHQFKVAAFIFFVMVFCAFVLVGCMKPIYAPAALTMNANNCVQSVAQTEIARINNSRTLYTDPTQALLAGAIDALAAQSRADPYSACYEQLRAFYAANSEVIQANAQLWRAGIGAAAVPASIFVGGWSLDRVLDSAGGMAIDATNSDLVIDSGSGAGSVVGRSGASDSPNVQNPTQVVDPVIVEPEIVDPVIVEVDPVIVEVPAP